MSTTKDIFTYAYRGRGKYLFIFCVIISIIGKLAMFAPLVGGFASLFISAYFCAVYFQLVQSSANGEGDAPDFPETSNLMEDIIFPFCKLIAIVLFSFSPSLAYAFIVGEADYNDSVGIGLNLLGIIYTPMAILATIIRGSILSISPHIIIPSIIRAGGLYVYAVIILVVIYTVQSTLEEFALGNIITKHIFLSFLSVYVILSNARALGIIYRDRQEELDWF